jgi:hypothetical protein
LKVPVCLVEELAIPRLVGLVEIPVGKFALLLLSRGDRVSVARVAKFPAEPLG